MKEEHNISGTTQVSLFPVMFIFLLTPRCHKYTVRATTTFGRTLSDQDKLLRYNNDRILFGNNRCFISYHNIADT